MPWRQYCGTKNGHALMTNIISKLKQACERRRIFLYGAGMYGKMLCAFMHEQNIGDVEKFIVSEAAGARVVLGREVITLEEYAAARARNCELAETELLIVAVSEKNSEDIVRHLHNREPYNYMLLTREEWDAIGNLVCFDDIIPQKNIAVLMYHRVIDSNYNFWKLNISPLMFEKHIKYISENYTVLRLEEEWDSLVQEDKKYVVVTFDDGYVDNYRYALPILEKYHIPATVFVGTDLIDTNEMYWWDELEKILIVDKYIGEFVFHDVLYKVADLKDREKACMAIRNHIKNMGPAERKSSMSALRSVLGQEQSYNSELRCVNTSELREMAASPYITIGGHTKSHLSMGSFHSNELLRSEIKESLNILEKKTGKRVEVFAYPFGGKEDRCDAADRIIAECGIRKTVLVRNGNVSVRDKMYNLPRHMMFEDDDIEVKMRRIWGLYG